jgi:phenylalanine-4-hydroxylase
MRPTTQIYSNYTQEDFSVWGTLFNRQMTSLESTVSKEYLEALDKVQFSSTRIPDFKKVDEILAPLTGWGLEVVPNICPQKEFFEFLSKRKFTATCWLRTMAQMDYLEEPDMFHDVFGHVPLLSNEAYCEFFRGMSNIALQHIDNPLAIELLSRVYWFTIEFGMIREANDLKIYGAGIISSHSETLHSLDKHTRVKDFDVETCLAANYRTDILQEQYFVIDSFEQLYDSLPQIDEHLKTILKHEKQTAHLIKADLDIKN